jgi:NAD(P)H-dependent FMN reductase
MKNILVFPASQRKQSINKRVAVEIANILQVNFSVEVLEPDSVDLPLFNQDHEYQSEILEKLEPVYRRFLQADGLIVVSPEYNGSVSPYLKNTVDWVSRLQRTQAEYGYINPFLYKPVLLASATPGGSGGVLGLQSARLIFAYLGSLVMAEQIILPFANQAWHADGGFADTGLYQRIQAILQGFGKVVESISAPQPHV